MNHDLEKKVEKSWTKLYKDKAKHSHPLFNFRSQRDLLEEYCKKKNIEIKGHQQSFEIREKK